MVIFMLHHPCGHARSLTRNRSARHILPTEGDSRRPLNRPAQAGDGKAAFPGFLGFLTKRLDVRVEQRGIAARRCPPDKKPKRNMHLGRGQPQPTNILQRFHHIADQAAHLGRGRVRHLLRPLQQYGVSQTGDFQNGHDFPATILSFLYN